MEDVPVPGIFDGEVLIRVGVCGICGTDLKKVRYEKMGYIFNPEDLQKLARNHLGLPHEEMVAGITNDLARAYPGHIYTKENWILSICGGVMGIMRVLHGSLSEYVLIYGTPIGTEGFSGRYRADIFDVLLAGEMWT